MLRLGEIVADSHWVQKAEQTAIDQARDVFESSRHRIYSLAFYMTDSEPEAEEVLATVFQRSFAQTLKPSTEAIDKSLVSELKERMPLGDISLNCQVEDSRSSGRNVKRPDLERAVVQLPPTERMIFLMHDVEGYDVPRIGNLLELTEAEVKRGLLQARLRMREILSAPAGNSASMHA